MENDRSMFEPCKKVNDEPSGLEKNDVVVVDLPNLISRYVLNVLRICAC